MLFIDSFQISTTQTTTSFQSVQLYVINMCAFSTAPWCFKQKPPNVVNLMDFQTFLACYLQSKRTCVLVFAHLTL
jgi:hypothetical protein